MLSDISEVARNFDSSKNPLPVTAYPKGSNKKIWWKCDQGHSYQRVVKKVTSNQRECPYCAHRKPSSTYNLAVLHKMAHEYHPTKNSKPPEQIMPGSSQDVWWRCSINPKHEWKASPEYRTHCNTCPRCNVENNLLTANPEVASMFHPTKNELGPESYKPKSTISVWWICPKESSHEWKAPIGSVNRDTYEGSGCPYCAGQKVCSTNSLQSLYPEIAKQFNVTKNGCTPSEVAKCSNKYYWWICPHDSKHEWNASVSDRTSGKGCPYCASRKPSPDYNLEVLFPSIAKEFDIALNPKEPSEYLPYSNFSVFWNCAEGHIWQSKISTRTSKNCGCPECAGYNKYSRAQIDWLDRMASEAGIFIEHAKNVGERYIKGVGFVDGYCPETNTVYEFHGDFWHGHPTRYNPEDINKVTKETFKECYEYTVARDKRVLSLGYKLVVKWETDIPGYVDSLFEGSPLNLVPKYSKDTFSPLKSRNYPQNGLFVKDSSLASEWHPTLNTLLPEETALNSSEACWWKCSKDPCGCHVWLSTVNNRAKGNGCPFCSRHTHCKHYNLATERPHLLVYWDPDNKVSPESCSPKGSQDIHWKCPIDPRHKWVKKPGSIKDKMKCPYCLGYKTLPETKKTFKLVIKRGPNTSNPIQPNHPCTYPDYQNMLRPQTKIRIKPRI